MVPPPHARMPDRTRTVAPARHEYPVIDDLGLVSRHADRLLAAARGAATFAGRPTSTRCPIGCATTTAGLRAAAVRARAAYGPKDSIRDACRGT